MRGALPLINLGTQFCAKYFTTYSYSLKGCSSCKSDGELKIGKNEKVCFAYLKQYSGIDDDNTVVIHADMENGRYLILKKSSTQIILLGLR